MRTTSTLARNDTDLKHVSVRRQSGHVARIQLNQRNISAFHIRHTIVIFEGNLSWTNERRRKNITETHEFSRICHMYGGRERSRRNTKEQHVPWEVKMKKNKMKYLCDEWFGNLKKNMKNHGISWNLKDGMITPIDAKSDISTHLKVLCLNKLAPTTANNLFRNLINKNTSLRLRKMAPNFDHHCLLKITFE